MKKNRESEKENVTFNALQEHKCVSLTTYRKNGNAVPTPVWFALENDKLYVVTEPGSGKVKRIRNNPNVLRARAHGWMMRVGGIVDRISGKKRDCCLEITPAE